jgi:putative membrane protein
MLRSMKLILKWLLSAAALLAVAHLYSGVKVDSFTAAMVAALVIGLLNTIVRPILVLLTLPVTLVTLGLFLFVINALMFWAAGGHAGGFSRGRLRGGAGGLADLFGSRRRDRLSAPGPVREVLIRPDAAGCQ